MHEPIFIISDFAIAGGAAWIAYLFWRTYRQTSAKRSLWLSALYSVFAIYFSVVILFNHVLQIHSFEWMGGHEALELILFAIMMVQATVLTVGASWKGSQLKPGAKGDQNKAA